MKFYFCEGCGKRVTEEDLSDGKGKNKKLKGVYCTSCSAGVMTMETLPISDEDASQILKESDAKLPKRGTPVSGSSALQGVREARRGSPRKGVKTYSSRKPMLKGQAGAESGRGGAFPDQGKTKQFVLPGIILGLVIVVGTFIFFSSGSKPKPKRPAVVESSTRDMGRTVELFDGKKADAGSALESAGKSSQDETDRELPEKIKSKEPGPPEDRRPAAVWNRLQTTLAALPEDDLKGRLDVVQAFIKQHPDADEAPRAGAMIRDLEAQLTVHAASKSMIPMDPPNKGGTGGAPQVPATVLDGRKASENADAANKVVVVPPKKPPVPERAAHQLAFNALLDGVLTGLRSLDWSGTDQGLKQKPTEETFKAWRPAAVELTQLVDVLKTWQDERTKQVQKFVGKVIPLKIKEESIRRAHIIRYEKGVLFIGKQFVINGKVKGEQRIQVAFEDLPKETQQRLRKEPQPQTPVAWCARAVEWLAKDKMDTADQALQKGKGAVLYEPLAWRLKLDRWERAEQDAKSAWQKLSEAAAGKPDEQTAHRLLKQLTEFEERYAATTANWERFELRTQLRARLTEIALAAGRRVRAVLHGKVQAFDSKTRKITVRYDFENKEQLADFSKDVSQFGRIGFGSDKRGLNVFSANGRVLYTTRMLRPFFAGVPLVVKLKYKFLSGFRAQPHYSHVFIDIFSKSKAVFHLHLERFGFRLGFKGQKSNKSRPYESISGFGKDAPKAGTLEWRFTEKTVTFKFNDQEIVNAEFSDSSAMSEGVHLQLGSKGAMSTQYQSIEMEGVLDKAWFDEEILKPARAAIKGDSKAD